MLKTLQAVPKTEAAAMLGVSRATVFNWAAAGKIKALEDGRIPLSEIERLAREFEPLPELEVVNAAQDAADYMTAYFDAQSLNAHVAVIGAAQRLAAAYGDAKTLKDRAAAETVLGERLENIGAAIASVAEAVDQFRAVQALAPMVKEVRGEANRLVREWDRRTKAAREQLKRDREAATDTKESES